MILSKFPGVITDTSLPIMERDDFIVPGVEALYDLATPYSYPGGAALNGAQVKDLTTKNRHASVVLGAGSLAYAGGGFDFTGRANGDHMTIPAGCLTASIANQSWMWMIYIKLPTLINMAATNNILPFAAWDLINSYINESPASLCTIGFSDPSTAVAVIRCATSLATDISWTTVNSFLNSELPNFYATVCQLAVWRSGGLTTMRLKNAVGTLTNGPASSAAVTAPTICPTGYVGIPNHAYAPATGQRTMRIYRIGIEHLATSGRNPVTALDEDWTRTLARGVFS